MLKLSKESREILKEYLDFDDRKGIAEKCECTNRMVDMTLSGERSKSKLCEKILLECQKTFERKALFAEEIENKIRKSKLILQK